MAHKITVIGGGLAGCEAAWQAARRGIRVILYEMKPRCFSPAHISPLLGELVCSNSLRSNSLANAVGLLKEEMRRLGSFVMQAADETRVPAGDALAVDRRAFAEWITAGLEANPQVEIIREEITRIPTEGTTVIASGPLTSLSLADSIKELTGEKDLYFYDAIAPIVEGESINQGVAFRASRYGEGSDYLNCPLNEEEYGRFIAELLAGEKVPYRDFETGIHFEGCLPIEEMAERGKETLAHGPMKPVGLVDPRTGKRPHAVVQLRHEDRQGTSYNLVGFQTKLKWKEQERIFRLIPGLEDARFLRFGSLHRNTFIHSPVLLSEGLQLKKEPRLFFAGQITGVEGYVESTAMGLLAGITASRFAKGLSSVTPPAATAMGSLVRYISTPGPKDFQPMNVNFGLFPPLPARLKGKDKNRALAERSLQELESWIRKHLPDSGPPGRD